MNIDRPFNNQIFRKSVFAFPPGMMHIRNKFFPGMPTEFLDYRNNTPRLPSRWDPGLV
jgi:hypothetical protein